MTINPSDDPRQRCDQSIHALHSQVQSINNWNIAPAMALVNQSYFTFFVLALLPFAVRQVDAYASIVSGDGNFMLHWAYSNNKLMFNMTCKTTGWCGVGFTTTSDGKNMVNYDMAVGGVNNTTYLDVSPSILLL